MEQMGVDLPEEPELAAQTIDTPAVENEEPPPERPEWLPDKFKQPEDLARSYSELESKLGEQGRQLSELQQALEAQQQQPDYGYDPTGQPYGYLDPAQEYIAQLYEENPVEATRFVLQQELAQMQQQAQQQAQFQAQQQQPYQQAQQQSQAAMTAYVTEQHMIDRYDDWEDVKDSAMGILQNRQIPQHELLSQPDFERHVDEAYRLAKYEALTGQEQEMLAAGISQEEINRNRKLQAETLTARRSAPREEVDPSTAEAQQLLAARQNSGRPGWYDR